MTKLNHEIDWRQNGPCRSSRREIGWQRHGQGRKFSSRSLGVNPSRQHRGFPVVTSCKHSITLVVFSIIIALKFGLYQPSNSFMVEKTRRFWIIVSNIFSKRYRRKEFSKMCNRFVTENENMTVDVKMTVFFVFFSSWPVFLLFPKYSRMF